MAEEVFLYGLLEMVEDSRIIVIVMAMLFQCTQSQSTVHLKQARYLGTLSPVPLLWQLHTGEKGTFFERLIM